MSSHLHGIHCEPEPEPYFSKGQEGEGRTASCSPAPAASAWGIFTDRRTFSLAELLRGLPPPRALRCKQSQMLMSFYLSKVNEMQWSAEQAGH
jgi:hypothetical protein